MKRKKDICQEITYNLADIFFHYFFIIMEIKTEYHGDLPEHEKYADLRSVYR